MMQASNAMPARRPDPMRDAAESEMARIAAFTRGEVGVAARHMGSGEELRLAAAGRYPLASTVKMALALAILDRVERGELSLTDMVEVREEEMNDPGGPIAGEFLHPGVALSVHNLLEVTITRSCNTATDVLFRLAGGCAAVQDYVKRLGIGDFEVSRTMREALCVLHELPLPPADVSVRTWLSGQPPEVLDARERTHGPQADYGHDRRDHATPLAMLELLRRLYQADGVAKASRATLLPIMERTPSLDRIKARLPMGAAAGTKSGSGAGTAADVGYLMLPGERGAVALAVYVKGSPLTMAERERAIADISRLVYDYFLIRTPAGAA
jgi:beta-lactamase class A